MTRRERQERSWLIRGRTIARDTTAKTRRACAIHEAGHAVAAHRMGGLFLRAWLNESAIHARRAGVHGMSEAAWRRQAGRYDPIACALVKLAGHEPRNVGTAHGECHARCTARAGYQWSICALGNTHVPVCRWCDVDLNRLVLHWLGLVDAEARVETYARASA